MAQGKKALVKISGDLLHNPGALSWFKKTCARYAYVLVVVGGGTQINAALRRHKLTVRFGPLGREVGPEGRDLARAVLLKNKDEIETFLREHAPKLRRKVEVVVPVISAGEVLCHVNGDEYVRMCYHGFDRLYVLTARKRKRGKQRFFRGLQKVHVHAV
jgi:acetylglutamate kinase